MTTGSDRREDERQWRAAKRGPRKTPRSFCIVHKRKMAKLQSLTSHSVKLDTIKDVRDLVSLSGGELTYAEDHQGGLKYFVLLDGKDPTAPADFGPFTRKDLLEWARGGFKKWNRPQTAKQQDLDAA